MHISIHYLEQLERMRCSVFVIIKLTIFFTVLYDPTRASISYSDVGWSVREAAPEEKAQK